MPWGTTETPEILYAQKQFLFQIPLSIIHEQNQFIYMGKLKIWAPEEDEILRRVNNSVKSKKWKKASEELHREGYERTDVECRERYINHLDPCVNKELWSDQELCVLYERYNQYGNRWYQLQKYLPGRTQTKIKNYFYGNIRYLLKVITKYFLKKSTGFINDIKTEVLLDMYEAKHKFQGVQIIPNSIALMGYRVQKQSCEALIRANEEEFYNFAEHFLRIYTEKSLGKLDKLSTQPDSSMEVEESKSELLRACYLVIDGKAPQCEVVQDKGLEWLQSMSTHHQMWWQYYQRAIENYPFARSVTTL